MNETQTSIVDRRSGELDLDARALPNEP